MKYINAVLLALFGIVAHVACAAFVTHGWAPQPLAVLTILAVWLPATWFIGASLIPAALILDLLSANHIPIITIVVLVSYGVSSLVQHRWLTNRSLASLAGIAFASLVAVNLVTTCLLIVMRPFFQESASVFSEWHWGSAIITVAVEWIFSVSIGLLSIILLRQLRKNFLYASR